MVPPAAGPEAGLIEKTSRCENSDVLPFGSVAVAAIARAGLDRRGQRDVEARVARAVGRDLGRADVVRPSRNSCGRGAAAGIGIEVEVEGRRRRCCSGLPRRAFPTPCGAAGPPRSGSGSSAGRSAPCRRRRRRSASRRSCRRRTGRSRAGCCWRRCGCPGCGRAGPGRGLRRSSRSALKAIVLPSPGPVPPIVRSFPTPTMPA